MMTNGPAARIGDILEVPFARPRDRHDVFEHPEYDRLRQHLISFLEDHAQPPSVPDQLAQPPKTATTCESFSVRRQPAANPKSSDAA